MYSKNSLKTRVPAALLAVGLGTIGLSACGAEVNPDEPATVLEHHHYGAWIQVVRIGKTTSFIPHPERFELKLEQCGHDGEDDSNGAGCITESVDVHHDTYQQFQDGDTIVLSDE